MYDINKLILRIISGRRYCGLIGEMRINRWVDTAMQQRNANKDRQGKKGSLKKSLAHSGHCSVNVSSRQGRERECKNEKNLENMLTH